MGVRLRSTRRLFEPAFFVLFAAVTTLLSARYFYSSMLAQTEGVWVAPLDDVFIHFDYARNIATGHPFEWSPGNGYSSGATSVLYPFMLSLGYLAGFQDLALVPFAGAFACTSVFVTLLLVRKAIERARLPLLSSYVFPVAMFGMGALAWSFWSGMEVAFFMATWALALTMFMRARTRVALDAKSRAASRAAWGLGICCVLMDLVRPEALVTTGVLAVALVVFARTGWLRRVGIAARVVLPVLAVVATYSVVNEICTGEAAASGAIVKLITYKPYLTPLEKLSDYTECLRIATAFTLMYHMSGEPNVGLVFLGLALLPLAFEQTRAAAIFLWAHVLVWVFFVAQNDQIRWQNQRYVMPAAAWFMLLVALGVGALCARARPIVWTSVLLAIGFALVAEPLFETPLPTAWIVLTAGVVAFVLALRFWPARAVAAVGLVALAGFATTPRLREQRWLFGRAARNIRDQQITLGVWIAKQHPRRVLLGDAGAIPYVAKTPALDAIGLGGYKKLPFARAKLQGVGATLELLERMPLNDRPDMLAIFPSWWGVLPTWFGRELKRFPAEGNVICGDYEHVAYRADFSALGTGTAPRSDRGRRGIVLDVLDVADLVSEREHRFEMKNVSATEPRLLPDPLEPSRDLFDAGRRIEEGRRERFVMRSAGSTNGKAASLVFRVLSEGDMRARFFVAGKLVAERKYNPSKGWEEDAIDVPADVVAGGDVPVEIESVGIDDFMYFHVWLVRSP